MKKLIIVLAWIASSFVVINPAKKSAPPTPAYITKDTTFLGYMARISYIPGHSDSTNLFLIMHGAGEVGATFNYSQSYGPHYWMNNGWDGSVVLDNGTHYPVYVTLQQSIGAYDQPQVLKPKVDAIVGRFKVRAGGLHLMGLSRGAWCWNHFIAYKPTIGNFTYARMVRTVTNFAGQRPDDNYGAAPNTFPAKFGHAVKNSSIKYFGVEQVLDNRQVATIVDNINDSVAGRTAFFWTNFGGSGHSNFNDMYSPFQTNWTLTNPDVQNSNGGVINTIPIATGQNVYQYLLRQSADTSLGGGTPPVNNPPTSNAGTDASITLPVATTSLSGSGSDPDGTVASYLWTKLSGPATGSITNASSASATANSLVEGVYVFRLQVTDNGGATATDTKQVTVQAAGANQPPVVNAGADGTITLPTSTRSLSGSATDDGTIVSYRWKQVKGAFTSTIADSTAASTTVSGLIQGKYQFRLTATDNNGLSSVDYVWVTVNEAVMVCNAAAPVTYTLAPTAPGEIYITNAVSRGWKGGDTLKIPAGTYSVIELSNMHGDSCRKIFITNTGGVVNIPNGQLRVKNTASYFHISGTGTPGVQYGFNVKSVSISIAKNFEINNVEAINSTGVGMYCKADPDTTNPNTIHPNYVMSNIKIHHNYFHDINGEAMYLGHTLPSDTSKGGKPIRLSNVEVCYNLIVNATWDGIQLSNSYGYNRIHHNTVINYGILYKGSQQAGIILGGNCNGDVDSNTVIKGTGNGIEVFGHGVCNVYGNIVDSCGWDTTALGQHSIYTSDYIIVSEPGNAKQTINFWNNAVKNPPPIGAVNINHDKNNALAASVYSNTFCIPGALANWQTQYLLIEPPGSTNFNNTLNCGTIVTPPPLPETGCGCNP